MSLIVVGLSHKSAPVAVRERLAFGPDTLSEVCRQITGEAVVREAMVLSTCNRVEVYAVPASDDPYADVSAFLARCTGVNDDRELLPHLYHYPRADAIGHMFRVASSLDSMVVGEPQILGQFKTAFETAMAAGSTGTVLNKLAKKAISVAKRVRTETRVAESAVSISYAAVELARHVFSDLSQQRALLLGAGEMGALAVRHLVAAGVTDVTVSARTLANAERLVAEVADDRVTARALPFADFPAALSKADIVICATGAREPVVTRQMTARAVSARGRRPMFLIDISVPRNIEPSTADVDDVYVYDIDDLQQVVDTNRAERDREASKAHRIINSEVDTAVAWLRSLAVVPTIIALRERGDAVARAEVARTLARLPDLDAAGRQRVQALADAVVAKLLHHPCARLRQESGTGDPDGILEATHRLFDLDLGAAEVDDLSSDGKENPASSVSGPLSNPVPPADTASPDTDAGADGKSGIDRR